MGKSQFWIALGLIVAVGGFGAVSANAGLFKKSQKTVVISRSLAVFPLDQNEELQVSETLGQDISVALRSIMGGNKQYSMIMYKELLPSIERGRNDTTIKLNEDKAPFAKDPAKPLKLARLLAVDCFVVGSIDECQVAEDQRSAQLTITMDLVDAKTGKILKTIVATGRTPDGSSVGGVDEAVALAAGDVVNKLKAQILELSPGQSKAAVAPLIPVKGPSSETAVKPKTPAPAAAAEKKSTSIPSTATGLSAAPSRGRGGSTRTNGNAGNANNATPEAGNPAVSVPETSATPGNRPIRSSGPRRQNTPRRDTGTAQGSDSTDTNSSGDSEAQVEAPPPPPPPPPGMPGGVPTAPDESEDFPEAPPVTFPAD